MTRVSSRRRNIAAAATLLVVLWLFAVWLAPTIEQTFRPAEQRVTWNWALGGFGVEPWVAGHVERTGEPAQTSSWSLAFSPLGTVIALLATLPILWLLRRGKAQVVTVRGRKAVRLEL